MSDATGPVVKPYEDLFSVMKSTNMDMSSSLEDIRGVMKALKENVTDSFNNVMTKMGNMGSTAQFLMMKIQAMVQKLLALYVTLLYFAWSMMKGLEAMIKDPVLIGAQGTLDTAVKLVEKPGKALKQVGKALKKGAQEVGKSAKNTGQAIGKSAKNTGKSIKSAFCFGPMTRVLLDDGKFKDMVDIKIGDKLLGGSIVTGTMKFNSKDTYLVDNSGIISTFDHHVLHNGIFKKSGSVPNAKVYTGQIPYLYDIDTSNHRITILNDNNEHIVYTDFTEVDHDNNYVYEYELSLLNNSIRKQTSPNSYIS